MIRFTPLVLSMAITPLNAIEQEAKPAATDQSVPIDAEQRMKNWREDLHALTTQLPAKHKNAFYTLSKDDWELAANALDQRLGALDDQMIALEFAKLVALIGDTHTQVQIDVNAQKYHVYPVILRIFSDGVFIVATWTDRSDLLGSKIIAIDQKPADEVIKRGGALFAVENESSLKNTVCNWIVLSEPLKSVGVSPSSERASFTVKNADGSEKVVILEALEPGHRVPFTWLPDATKMTMPIAWQRRKESYWFEPIKDENALYIRYDRCANDADKSVKEFSEETLAYIHENKPGKIIIDLRRNSGGNSALLHPFIGGLAKNADINRKGKLFVLIGRTTFSSAMMNAQELRSQTKAILVGEPTGGKPNHFGEIKFFDLPNSKLKVQYSTKQFKMVDDDPPSVMPDVTVEMSSTDFFAGRDSVMDAVLKSPAGDSD